MSLNRVARIAFVCALIFAVVMALLPKPPDIAPGVGDKYLHMLAFATLTLLARLGYPAASSLVIGERLSFLGALIEVFQSIPMLHRDCDPMDWVADTAAVAVVLFAWAVVHRIRQ